LILRVAQDSAASSRDDFLQAGSVGLPMNTRIAFAGSEGSDAV